MIYYIFAKFARSNIQIESFKDYISSAVDIFNVKSLKSVTKKNIVDIKLFSNNFVIILKTDEAINKSYIGRYLRVFSDEFLLMNKDNKKLIVGGKLFDYICLDEKEFALLYKEDPKIELIRNIINQ